MLLVKKVESLNNNINSLYLLEKILIEHCSPTIASIKTANLFNISFKNWFNNDENYFIKNIEDLQNLLLETDLKLVVLNIDYNKKTSLIYVYRESLLEKDLNNKKITKFLKKYGYNSKLGKLKLLEYIDILKNKINNYNCFPHEIGIFLGYPLDDVNAFILNKGKNFNYCGYWKVYYNLEESIKKFNHYDSCKLKYIKLFNKGYTLKQLATIY